MSKTLHKIKTAIGIILTFRDFPKFFAYYFGLKKSKTAKFHFWNGLVWNVDASKRGFAVISDVWVQKPYRLLNKIKKPELILDFGAHIGSFSIMAAKKFPNAKIYAFEASKENFDLLKNNLKENKIRNVFPINAGVSSKDGFLDFYIDKNNTVLNSFKKRPGTIHYKVKCISVKTIFDELKIKKCDFLKLDIEGLEYEILKSIEKNSLFEKINAVATEIIPKTKEFGLAEKILSKNGFKTSINKPDIIEAIK